MNLPAARMTDTITSPATLGAPVPIIPPCALTVLIMGLPAARVTDNCGVDAIAVASFTVLTSGLFQARLLDKSASGGVVSGPCAPTVLIG